MNPQHLDPMDVTHLEEVAIDQMEIGENKRIEALTRKLDYDVKVLDYIERLADGIMKSGTVKAEGDSDPRAVAVLKMQIGHELGMSPAQALKDVYIIKGVPSVSAHWKAQKMRQAGYSWDFIQHDNEVCKISLNYRGNVLGEVSYSIEDARRAKLVKDDKDDSNWIKTPKNMVFARCISNAQRWFAPETQGASYPALEEIDLDTVVTSTMQQATERKTADLAKRLSNAKAPATEATI
jgi:hypothetical protein